MRDKPNKKIFTQKSPPGYIRPNAIVVASVFYLLSLFFSFFIAFFTSVLPPFFFFDAVWCDVAYLWVCLEELLLSLSIGCGWKACMIGPNATFGTDPFESGQHLMV